MWTTGHWPAGVDSLAGQDRLIQLRESGPKALESFRPQSQLGVGFAKHSRMALDGTADKFESPAGQVAVFRSEPN
ncbi:hypothetical protein DIJ64_00290 [Mycobacterium leprae]|uniref:Uncharacterized protein n=1 Tax=Mycobacterium leprae TaxID=1769 RepID=A0AAD0KQZ8_MYCLR|nr:hypothetical protein DIJ64_00290 [Mycobacterium leprae]